MRRFNKWYSIHVYKDVVQVLYQLVPSSASPVPAQNTKSQSHIHHTHDIFDVLIEKKKNLPTGPLDYSMLGSKDASFDQNISICIVWISHLG